MTRHLCFQTLNGPQARVLLVLLANPGSLRVQAIAHLTERSDRTVSRHLHSLVAGGWIERVSRTLWRVLPEVRALLAGGCGEAEAAPRAPGSAPAARKKRRRAKPDAAPRPPESESVRDSLKDFKNRDLKDLKIDPDSDSDSPPPVDRVSGANDPLSNPGTPASKTATRELVAQILDATDLLFGEPVLGPPERYPDPDLLLATIAEAYTWRARLATPARVVYANLKKGRPPSLRFRRDPLALLPPDFLQAAGLAAPETEGPQAEEPEFAEPDPPRRPADDLPAAMLFTPDPSVHLPVGPPFGGSPEPVTAARAWELAVDQVRLDMTRMWFETYLRPAQLVRYDPAEGLLTVLAQSGPARDWLDARLVRSLERALVGCCARSDLRVRFSAPSAVDITRAAAGTPAPPGP